MKFLKYLCSSLLVLLLHTQGKFLLKIFDHWTFPYHYIPHIYNITKYESFKYDKIRHSLKRLLTKLTKLSIFLLLIKIL